MPDDEAQPFHVHQADGAYHVYQGSDIAQDGGRIIMKCHDEASADGLCEELLVPGVPVHERKNRQTFGAAKVGQALYFGT